MPDLAIHTEHLARRFGRRWALSDVSIEIPAGSVTMVTGRNGSGKSTLFRLLATAIRPDFGRGRVLGFDLVEHRHDVRAGVAMLAHASYLYEALTARENLEVTADHLNLDRQPIPSLLARVDLAERAADPVSTFSAGMRKRLSFARVLLQRPRLVLLDEPYAQLDPAGFDLVDGFVRELKAAGLTVLIATHQKERTEPLAELAMHLEGGRVESLGPVGSRG